MPGQLHLTSKQKLLHAFYYLVLLLFAAFYLLPFWGAITTSLKSSAEVFTTSPLSLPDRPTLEAYVAALNHLKKPLINSIVVTIGGTFFSVLLGSMCGYVFAQYRFKFDNIIFVLVVSAIFLPYQAILVPLFQTIRRLGLYDSVWGLILAHTVYGIPMMTLMFRSFYGDVPKCLVQQAMLDGYGPWTIYRRVILPSTKIATVTGVVFQFASIWNELLFALVLTGYDAMPATVSLNQMMGTLAAEWNVQMAGSIWLAMPVLVLYIVMGKYLIRGYMAGSVAAT
ncbi:MAG TPA: carbohydrate ABC transporter permease [Firmicutes bacterium]|nr:carbohydrate ABC transporter permease [Bacillota bacterium]